MKLKKAIAIILVTVISVINFSFAMTASAATLRNENSFTSNATLHIDSGKVATVNAQYNGYSGVVTKGRIEIQLQKKVLLWWTDVSGGNWINTYFADIARTNHSLQLSDSGKYRAVVNFTIYTASGETETDEIIVTAEC